jgi:hypothetical protein
VLFIRRLTDIIPSTLWYVNEIYGVQKSTINWTFCCRSHINNTLRKLYYVICSKTSIIENFLMTNVIKCDDVIDATDMDNMTSQNKEAEINYTRDKRLRLRHTALTQ